MGDGIRRDATGRDSRTNGQRRADALVELVRRALNHADQLDVPSSGAWPARVAITMSHDDLVTGVGTATLDTGEQLSASVVRQIACDCEILPAVLGGPGIPLDLGHKERLWKREPRLAVALRDRGCAFPACDRPPSYCQVHHVVHWLDGGRTDLGNGVLLCGFHHRLIHAGEWQVRMAGDQLPEFLPPAYLDPERRPRRNLLRLRC